MRRSAGRRQAARRSARGTSGSAPQRPSGVRQCAAAPGTPHAVRRSDRKSQGTAEPGLGCPAHGNNLSDSG